ncbi:hypothetical protein VNO80_02795 [Phaseolus coccineus]|uniref:Uncharacterized protein n=1 Tax=Phaseolus coccineus TaxID=3886 RepID=A0AAN9NQK2_PHACN
MSIPGDARMSLAPWRCPHASRPGDVRMPRALAMPASLSRPGDASMPRALAIVGSKLRGEMQECLVWGQSYVAKCKKPQAELQRKTEHRKRACKSSKTIRFRRWRLWE